MPFKITTPQQEEREVRPEGRFKITVPQKVQSQQSKGRFKITIPRSQEGDSKEPISKTGTFLRSAAQAAIPTVAAIKGGLYGSRLGLVNPWLAIPGAIGGAYASASAASLAQKKAAEIILPEETERKLTELQTRDITEHPKTALAGELAPALASMRLSPSVLKLAGSGLSKLARSGTKGLQSLTPKELSSIANVTLGPAVTGGAEAAREISQEGKIDPSRLAMATGVGFLTQEPTALGRKLGIPSILSQGKVSGAKRRPSLPPSEAVEEVSKLKATATRAGEVEAVDAKLGKKKIVMDDTAEFDKRLDLSDIKTPEAKRDVGLVRENLSEYRESYLKEIENEYGKGTDNVVSADIGKTIPVSFRENFRPEHSSRRHAAASTFAKMFEDELLSNPNTKNKPGLLLAGGSGVAKTTLLKRFGGTKNYSMVKDSNLSSVASAKKSIEKILSSGRKVKILFVDRDPIVAFTDGVYKRFKGKPEHRIVPVDVHVKNHESRNVIKEIQKLYKDNPDVEIELVGNYGDNTASAKSIQKLKDLGYNMSEVKDKLIRFIQEKEVSGEITRSEADEFIGRKSDVQASFLGRPSDRKPQQEPQRGVFGGKSQEVGIKKEPGSNVSPAVSQPLPKYAPVNLNLKRLDTVESVKESILEWRNQNKAVLESDYERFRKGDLYSRLQAEAPEVDVPSLMESGRYDLNTPQGQKDLLADTMALRRLNVGLEEQKARLREAMESPASSELQKQAAVVESLALDAQQLSVSLALQKRTQLAGQFLRMFNELSSGTTPMEQKVQALQNIAKKRFGLGTKEYAIFIEGMKQLQLDNPRATADVLKALAQDPSKADLFWEYWYFNLLSGLPSHEANFFGNSFKLISEAAIVKPVSAIGEVVSTKSVSAPTKALQGYYAGLVRGTSKGLKSALSIMKTGFDPQELADPGKWAAFRFEAWGRHPNPAIRRVAPVINFFGRALKASDAIFRSSLEQAEFLSRVYRKASTEKVPTSKVLRSVKDGFDSTILTKSKDYAAYGTFNQQPGKLTQQWMNLVQKAPGVRFLTPFVRIASNLTTQGLLDYSPAGFVRAVVRGDIDGIQRADSMVRAGMGSILLMQGGLMWAQGLLNLEAPTEPTERDQFFREGRLPWSIRIGNHWVPLKRFEPFVTPFLAGAILSKTMKEGGDQDKDIATIIVSSATEVGRLTVDSSYLSGLHNFFSMFDRGYSTTEKASSFAAGMATSLIPASSMLRAITQSYDPTVKDPKGFMERVKAQIPVVSKEVPTKQDVFGEQIKRPGSPFSFIKPAAVSDDPVTVELQRTGVRVGFPQKKVKGEKLTEDQYRKYQSTTGKVIYKVLSGVVQSRWYSNLDDSKKKEILDEVVDRVSSKVRKRVREAVFR